MLTAFYRYFSLPALIAATLLTAAASDVRHGYYAYKLLEQAKSKTTQVMPLLKHDLALDAGCKWPKSAEKESDFPACMAKVVPDIKTSLGLYIEITKASVWISQHPEDQATRSLAMRTMDRLWEQYRKEESYGLIDQAALELDRSVLYRAFHGEISGDTAQMWEQRLTSLEVAVNDPALAQKQEARTRTYEMEDAQAALQNSHR
jgi:hypothetical protein